MFVRSIGGAVGINSLVDDRFCVDADKCADDIDPSDEFGILRPDDIEWSWTDECTDEILLSLICDAVETERKLELEDILKRRTSKPGGIGTRTESPGGKSGNDGNTAGARAFNECGTFPTVIGTVIIKFL